MRILVTGGAGYVGSHVVRALLEEGHEPTVYDNLSTGHSQAVVEAELVVGDVGDTERLTRLLSRQAFDGCIHLAAVSLVGESMRNPSLYFRNNVSAGLSLFDALVRASVPWVVLSSTAAVYGEPESTPIAEGQAKLPTNPYGESKLMLEKILGWYEVAHGLKHIALRYFNAAGAHPFGHIGEDHTPETHLIPLLLQTALGHRETAQIYGTDYDTPDGTAVRDYVHVCDLADAHLGAAVLLHHRGPSGEYNLGSGQGYSVLDVINVAREVTGRDIAARAEARRAGDPEVLIASSECAKGKLGWEPKRNLQVMVDSAWQWHKANPLGYEA